MDNTEIVTKKTVQSLLDQPAIKARINEVLASKANTFTASLLSLINSNDSLRACEPNTVFIAALTAASLDLPINQNLGYAYIIPYKDKSGQMVAQFQLGYRGMLQLAQRSGQFETLNITDIREGEITDHNRMTGELSFKWIEVDRDKKETIGYLAYFKLLNGFSKNLYMTVGELKSHGLKYSQTFKKGYGVWKDDFDAMAKKTVMKLLIAKYAPMSVEMNRAVVSDQAILRDIEVPEYVDNQSETVSSVARQNEVNGILKFIRESNSLEALETVKHKLGDDELLLETYENKIQQLKENK